MRNQQRMGAAEPLNPPVVRDGVAYGLALRFKASPESDPWPGREIVRGRIHSVTDLGGGVVEIAAERAPITSSRTRVLGVGNSFEETWESMCGGNVANPPEPLRLYGAFSTLAYRGDMREMRLEPMDIILVGPREAQQAIFLTEVEAFGIRPASVDWRPGSGSARRFEWNASWIQREAGGETFGPAIEPPSEADRITNPALAVDLARTVDGAGHWRGSGFFLEQADAPGDFVRLTRRVFSRPADGAPDEEYFPAGATLAAGEYWIHGRDLSFVLASRNAEIGTRLITQHWVSGWRRWSSSLAVPQVMAGANTGEPDELGGVESPTSEDATLGLFLYDDGAGDFGEGWLLWRFVLPGGGSAAIAAKFAGNSLVSAKAKPQGGSWATLSMTPIELTPTAGFVVLTIAKSGSTCTVLLSDGANTNLPIASANLGALVGQPVHNGYIGVRCAAGSTARFAGLNGFSMEAVRGAQVWRQQFTDWGHVQYSIQLNVGLALNPEAVASAITGEPYQAAASTDAARARRRFFLVEPGVIRLYSENCPDVLNVAFPGLTSPGSAPGRAPRVTSGIRNLATFADPETLLGTTDPDENRANWYDRLRGIVADPDHPPVLAPGVEFVGYRCAVLDPRYPCSLQYSYRPSSWSEEDEPPEWQDMPEGSVFGRPAEGLFLVAQSWLEEIPEGARPCFRLVGRFITHHANLDARTINELGDAIDALETLSFRCQLGGGGEVGLGGIAVPFPLQLVPTGYRLEFDSFGNAVAVETGRAWGLPKDVWTGPTEFWGEILDFGSLAPPVWTSTYYLGSLGGGYHGVAENATPILTHNDQVLAVAGQLVTRNIPCQLWTAMEIPGDPGLPRLLGFGSLQPARLGDPPVYTSFKLTAIPFELPPQLRRAPPGLQVVSATVEVRLSGVSTHEWEWEIEQRGPHWPAGSGSEPGSYFRGIYRINGERFRELVVEEGVTITNYARPGGVPPPRVSAPLSFDLVGRRRSTARVYKAYLNASYLWSGGDPEDEAARIAYIGGGDYANIPADGWTAFPSAGALLTDVPADKWTVVDIRHAMQACIDARESLFTDLYLVPRGLGAEINAGLGDLALFLNSCLPQATIEIDSQMIDGVEWWTQSFGLKGQDTRFASVELRNLIVSVRLPSGAIETFCPPIPRRAMGVPS